MTIHIFNPEHDLALAAGLSNFTAPHAGRQLRHDLGFLPALWAGDCDVVLVDDVDVARRSYGKLQAALGTALGTRTFFPINSHFPPSKVGVSSQETPTLLPWGWNGALKALLLRTGYAPELLPSDEQLATIRQLSHRREAAWLLSALRMEETIGDAFECYSIDEMKSLSERFGQVVLKAPWSSSGRGIRFWNNNSGTANVEHWACNVIRQQGTIMVEPYYNKVKDFGMEFLSDGKGRVTYEGLSLFQTVNGAYTGNIIATEQVKRSMINRYISADLLDAVKEKVCTLLGNAFCGKYCGPFGIDMMVVNALQNDKKEREKSNLLHPCVEINLRRTMGHVALALGRRLNPTCDEEVRYVMRIVYSNNNYKLTIKHL